MQDDLELSKEEKEEIFQKYTTGFLFENKNEKDEMVSSLEYDYVGE